MNSKGVKFWVVRLTINLADKLNFRGTWFQCICWIWLAENIEEFLSLKILSVISSVQLLSCVWLFATPWTARPPCPSPTPGVHSNSCPSSRWCHPTIPSSVILFSPCPQSFPESGSFPMRQLFGWGGQSIGVSDSASVLPMNTQDWSTLGWASWISLALAYFFLLQINVFTLDVK